MKPHLLIIELHHLGDAVMALPFLRGAVEKYQVTVFCHPGVGRLLGFALPEVLVINAGESWWEVCTRMRALKRLPRPAISLCAWPDPRVHVLMAWLNSPQRIGFGLNSHNFIASNVEWRKRRMKWGRRGVRLIEKVLFRKSLTEVLDKKYYEQHHLADWKQLAEFLGFEMNTSTPWAPIPPLDPEIRSFLDTHTGCKVLVVHAGGRLPTKRWPVDRFSNVLKKLDEQPDVAVLVIDPIGEDIPSVVGERQMVVQTPGFPELAAVLAQADVVLANDSFAGHLAGALGRRVVTLFGSGNPQWFAPYGEGNRSIRVDECPHHPCLDRCVMPSPICLEAIAVDSVLATVVLALKEETGSKI